MFAHGLAEALRRPLASWEQAWASLYQLSSFRPWDFGGSVPWAALGLGAKGTDGEPLRAGVQQREEHPPCWSQTPAKQPGWWHPGHIG